MSRFPHWRRLGCRTLLIAAGILLAVLAVAWWWRESFITAAPP